MRQASVIVGGVMAGMLTMGGFGTLGWANPPQKGAPAPAAATAPAAPPAPAPTAAAPAPAAQANNSFAYVDVPKVLASCDASKSARDMLKKKLSDKQKEIDAMEQKIKKMKDELEKKNSLMKPDVRNKQAEEVRKQFREYQRLVEDNQAAIDQENTMWTKKIMEALKDVLEEMGREKGYVAVFGKGQVLFTSSGIDITDQVLKRLNKHTEKWF